jgi:hypothetical protein
MSRSSPCIGIYFSRSKNDDDIVLFFQKGRKTFLSVAVCIGSGVLEVLELDTLFDTLKKYIKNEKYLMKNAQAIKNDLKSVYSDQLSYSNRVAA